MFALNLCLTVIEAAVGAHSVLLNNHQITRTITLSTSKALLMILFSTSFFRVLFLSRIIMTRMTFKLFRIVAMSSHLRISKKVQSAAVVQDPPTTLIRTRTKRTPMTSITWPGLTMRWKKPCNSPPVFYCNLQNVMKNDVYIFFLLMTLYPF